MEWQPKSGKVCAEYSKYKEMFNHCCFLQCSKDVSSSTQEEFKMNTVH